MPNTKFHFNLKPFVNDLKKFHKTTRLAQIQAAREIGYRWENEAKDRTPILTGMLTLSVVSEVEEFNSGIEIRVSVPADSAASDYAIKMHEDQTYHLGKDSAAKALKIGKKVGTGYISDSLSELHEEFLSTLEFHLQKV